MSKRNRDCADVDAIVREYLASLLFVHPISCSLRLAVGGEDCAAPMDFSAWYEVFLDGRWFTLDARHNHPRIGRIVIAKGRDAADVAISTASGPAQLARFKVVTEELVRED